MDLLIKPYVLEEAVEDIGTSKKDFKVEIVDEDEEVLIDVLYDEGF